MGPVQGRVFDIQRFSVHDGPGIRTTFFLKGCPLRCKWCHNPEGLQNQKQMQYIGEKCISCGQCMLVCKQGCHTMKNGAHHFSFEHCINCFDCLPVCPSKALTCAGFDVTAEEVVNIAKRDLIFYRNDGGVTFSGGESTMQADFLVQGLSACKKAGLNTAVDTAGYCDWSVFERILPIVDTFLYDVKAVTPALHKSGTGVDNAVIIENLRKLAKAGANIWIRIPVIPEFNATKEEMTGIADFLATIPQIKRIECMPYHKLGQNKYEQLGMDYLSKGLRTLAQDEMKSYFALFIERGLPLFQGETTKA